MELHTVKRLLAGSTFLSAWLFVATVPAPAAGQRVVELPSSDFEEVSTYQPVPDFDIDRIRDEILNGVNRERKADGLDAMRSDAELSEIAFRHSRDMAESGYFGHVNLRGQDAGDRAHESGYLCVPDLQHPVSRPLGENLYTGFLYESYRLIYGPVQVVAEFDWNSETQLAQRVVQGWMDSPPHRANMLHDGYRLVGVGIFITDAFEIYVTQILC